MRERLERLLFAIAVHGVGTIHDHVAVLRSAWRYDQDAFRQIRYQLMEAGMPHWEVMDLVRGDDKHYRDCACWRCVTRLHNEVFRSWCERQQEAASDR